MPNKKNNFADGSTFSQRYGYAPLPKQMQLEELSDALRREIWNETRRLLFYEDHNNSYELLYDSYELPCFTENEARLFERVLGKLWQTPEDEIDTRYETVWQDFKELILKSDFNVVLDLIEYIANDSKIESIANDSKYGTAFAFADNIRESFERCAAAYYLDMSCHPHQFIPRSNQAQGGATRKAIETISAGGMEGAETHLRQAAAHIDAQRFADSVRDSIHAVESVARQIDPKSKTLGPALNALEKAGLIKHPALKGAFSKLYGYTSDEQGIRHALLDKAPDVELDEAMFMFGACASFAAYLVNKHQKP